MAEKKLFYPEEGGKHLRNLDSIHLLTGAVSGWRRFESRPERRVS
jgi:hypothetical protein